jgi:hypothetical protein
MMFRIRRAHPSMKILLYINETEEIGERLKSLVRSKVPEESIEILPSFGTLVDRLKHPLDRRSIAVLLASCREDLAQFVSVKALFKDLRILLIAPDEESTTIALAHLMRPRFLGSLTGDFSLIHAVLSKMLENPPPSFDFS